MALTLLRHTTPDVSRGLCYGVTDLALVEGYEQEIETALSGLNAPTAIISSPLTRCLRLAEGAARHFGLELSVSTHWQEMDFGQWEGRKWSDIPRAELDAWAEDFMGYDGHGGESVAMLEARVRQAMADAPEGALIVTHMGCIKAALAISGGADGWQAKLGFGASLVLSV